MTFTDYSIRLDSVINGISNDSKYFIELFANEIAQAVEHRVHSNAPKSSSGGATPKYSVKTTLVGAKSFLNKTNAGTFFKQKGLKWVTKNGRHLAVLPGGYKELRTLNNKTNANKNYEWTGSMWANFGIKKLSKTGAVIGGKTKDSQDKINWNSARDGGSIIEPSQSEIRLSSELVINEIAKRFKAAGL